MIAEKGAEMILQDAPAAAGTPARQYA
jgi:hypothetical protein